MYDVRCTEKGNDAEMSSAKFVAISPLKKSDEDEWRLLWKAYLEYYETILPEAVYASTFKRMQAGNAGDLNEFRGFIARVDGRAAGLVHFYYHRHGWKIENVCYLQDLFVSPGIRGTGLGRKLIESVYADADAMGAPSVYWLTQDFNEAGRRLYDRVGALTPFIKYSR